MTEKQYTYARFWKCALQVNPAGYAAAYRGQKHGLSGEGYLSELLQVCNEENIKVVGLADHGSVQDVNVIRDFLLPHGIVVFPGFEISSTEKIHMVCLFPEDTSTDQLQRILGKLDLMDPEERVTPSRLGCLAIARIIQDRGGFWFAAHVTGRNGLLRLNQDGGGLVHVWKEHGLVQAGQIPESVDGLPANYRQIVLNNNPDYWRERRISAINAKDIANPEDLRDTRACTLIKMTRPCFASFLMAFKDPESRVRLTDQMAERYYSRISSVRVEGGYFDGLDAGMSRHLNAVIGGRGTGKSTLLECLRYALDVPHKGEEARRQGDQIVKENLGKAGGRVIIELESAANNMKRYKVVRRYGEPPRVIDENGDESALHPGKDLVPGVEIYGQNEIYELAKSPGALTRVLDRFLPDIAAQQSRLDAVRKKLKENAERLLGAQEQKDELEGKMAQLPKLQEQVRQFKEQGLEEKLKQVPLLEKERQLGPRMMEELERTRSGQRQLAEALPDLVFLSEKALYGLPHAELLRRGRKLLEDLDAKIKRNLQQIGAAVDEAGVALTALSDEMNRALAEAETVLEKEFAKLPAVAGKDGKEIGRTYQGLLREIELVKPAQARLKTVDALVKELQQVRRNLLGEMSDLRSARAAAKHKEVKRLNKRLEGKLRIEIVADGLRHPLRDFLQALPGIGEKKTGWVDKAEDLTIMGLVAAIREGKESLMEKGWGLTSGVADALTRLTPAQLFGLEAIDLEERISLKLNVSHAGKQFRELERLSTGQQCTAILHLLLLDNRDPLIMDQPEDNLDNAFIAERIVQELRSAKTERQFLFATHNANIPVFGDAEWIGVCSASEDHAEMTDEAQGSIDIPAIRDQVASILEGGKEAFMQRKEKYGFDY